MIFENLKNSGLVAVKDAVTGIEKRETMIVFHGTGIIWRFEKTEEADQVFKSLVDTLDE